MSARWLRARLLMTFSCLYSFRCSNHLEHEENLQRHGGSRSGICHTTLVPITTFANLSDSCALAEDNGQTFHSDSFGNTYDNRDGTVGRTELLGIPIATEMGR